MRTAVCKPNRLWKASGRMQLLAGRGDAAAALQREKKLLPSQIFEHLPAARGVRRCGALQKENRNAVAAGSRAEALHGRVPSPASARTREWVILRIRKCRRI